jgi:acetylornithine deacetylase/succinyl-diaminopimelate desuccinylase-like protein
MDSFYDELGSFISMRSVAGDKQGNNLAVKFVVDKLFSIGFQVSVEGESEHHQPCVIAKLSQGYKRENKGIVLYNHYDVEPSNCDAWESYPFKLSERNNRLYARGIADNKAVLLARLEAIENLLKRKERIPDILWLIQGEEEAGSKTAHQVFPKYMNASKADLFLEETGYYRDGRPHVFSKPKKDEHKTLVEYLNTYLFSGEAKIENRYMRKFQKCPFRSNIPSYGCYLAFGPNDYEANIHKENESISKVMLMNYIQHFEQFLVWAKA